VRNGLIRLVPHHAIYFFFLVVSLTVCFGLRRTVGCVTKRPVMALRPLLAAAIATPYSASFDSAAPREASRNASWVSAFRSAPPVRLLITFPREVARPASPGGAQRDMSMILDINNRL
jgi:hypothetical protein